MFEYLSEKILKSDFKDQPFKHIEIKNFFNKDDFQNILKQSEIKFPPFSNDEELIDHLQKSGYSAIPFPGCITNPKDYIKWDKNKSGTNYNVSSTEGFGMTYRLMQTNSTIINNLKIFFEGDTFKKIISEKFSLDLDQVTFDQGIQKYLDGYEISPHPDIRLKALTYMININPSSQSEDSIHHTHYLKFKSEYRYVQEYWKWNKSMDRCWVPWHWCETIKKQSKNNSIVIFEPDDNTMHAVNTDYDHLIYQRTQIYGNFWWKKELKKITDIKFQPKWENFVINKDSQKPRERTFTKIKNKIKRLF